MVQPDPLSCHFHNPKFVLKPLSSMCFIPSGLDTIFLLRKLYLSINIYFFTDSSPQSLHWYTLCYFSSPLSQWFADSMWSHLATQSECFCYCCFFFLFLEHLFLNLQCCVGFCHKTMQISHNYTYIPCLLVASPLPSSHPPGHHRVPDWAPCATQQVLTSSPSYTWHGVYVDAILPIYTHSPCPSVSTGPFSTFLSPSLAYEFVAFNCGLLTALEHFPQ